jgi:phage terminase large subunit
VKVVTIAGDISRAARIDLDARRTSHWPNPYWADKPEEFARYILGVSLWGYQVEALRNVRDHRHTAISGGRKIGKDFLGAVCAWWWYGSQVDGRVMAFGPSMKQIDKILWREVRALWLGHGRCVDCKRKGLIANPCPHSARLDGKAPGMSAKTGKYSPDGMREIIGLTAVGEGGLVGFSGNILAIQDEAAFIKDANNTMLEGNLAGENTRRLAISNPVRSRGFFYDMFHRNRGMFANPDGTSGLFQVSSLESPNVVEGKTVFPGLASKEWVDERKSIWGEGSAPWLWHVEGRFLSAEAGQLLPPDAITAAELRWDEGGDDGEEGPHQPESSQEGRLQLGVDCAGETLQGDESAFAVRRSLRCLDLQADRGLSPEGHLNRALEMIQRWRRPFDQGENYPVVVVDADGETGWRVFTVFRAYEREHPGVFKLVGFHGSHKPQQGNLKDRYRLNRDLLFGGLVDWFRDGGAIPTEMQLEAELVTLRWVDAEMGKLTLVAKSEIREELQGKSPDRADALALATWGSAKMAQVTAIGHAAPAETRPFTRARSGQIPEKAYLGQAYGVERKGRR